MRTTQQLSITLPTEMAQKVKAKVASGDYASESEVIREGLRALDERDAVVEKWLREEVVPTYDAWKANPDDTLSLDEVFQRLADRRSRQDKTSD
ncbi:MAG: type II toxin-antitoxin system ParD family antitoxin [Pseudomonadota bacterium]